MEWVTLITGAGIALGSAFLGTVTEAMKSWVVRRNTIADRKSAFQHRTAVELQELLYELMRSSVAMLEADVDAFKMTGNWGNHLVPDRHDNEARIQRVRANILVERLIDSTLREEVEELIKLSLSIHTSPSHEAALDALIKASDQSKKVSKLLGKVIRDSWPE